MERHAIAVVLGISLTLGGAGVASARVPTGAYEAFRVKTDNVPQAEIAGWVLPAKGRGEGTLFMLHGYNNSKEYLVGWEWLRDRANWNVLLMDFREHGESTKTAHLSTLGYYEIWDVKAVVDYAERRGLPRPYVIFGRSLGGATGLRWASMDPRISGVLAVSPFKNAFLASKQLPAQRLHIGALPSPFTWSGGFRKMLEEVDIPKAVAKRDDLRIWIMTGEFDSFPEADQREILNASASPAEMKRLVIAGGCDHRNVWTWKGAAGRPGHDEYLKEFLAVTTGRAGRGVWGWVGLIVSVFTVGVAGMLVFVRRMGRGIREQTGGLPEPTTAR